MLRDNLHKTNPVKHYGFLVQVDAEEGTSIDLLKDHLEGACTWVEGAGRTDVEFMGELEQYEEAE